MRHTQPDAFTFPRAGVFIIAAFLIKTSNLYAAAGTQGAAFLQIPVGAGPAALGSAYSALAADAYAPVWNPAGLGFLQSPQLAGQHLSYLESLNYEHLGFVVPLHPEEGKPPAGGALGVTAQYLGSGDIAGRDPSGQPTGDYSSHFAAYSLAYGHALGDKLSLGLTTKWINEKLGDYSANAYAVDLGSLYRVRDNTTLAVTVTNIGSKLNFINEDDSLPTAVHAGAAYRAGKFWLVSAEGVFETAGAANGRFGLEWQPMEALSLRAGYRTDTLHDLSALAGFSTGLGLTLWGQEFAYAWVPYGDLGDTQYFSLLIKFGETSSNRNLIRYQALRRERDAGDIHPDDPEYRQLIQLLSVNDGPVSLADSGQAIEGSK